ncbi:cactin [Spodoptera litura]|uniref:Splicing factor Cactin n=1 Tax=Spodoptera litura TaxID=69820 RepID=A0A9J7DVW3_SPOLT|nr:cactin [Spodoptera litura]
MSSRHEVQRHERSESASSKQRNDHRHKSYERTRPQSPKSSKQRSDSRDRTKHKKSKKKKRQSSSSSSSSDEEELKLLQRLEAERLRLKEEKKKQKELLKANETPEEKRARRLREKQEKERKRRERMGWDNEYQCYTNQDNPFGDSALTNTFVWTKKLAKEGVKTVSRDELEALNRQKQLENKIELEKVKQRRLEREAERVAREAEAAAAARAREALQFHTWARQEDAFHLHQARLRSQIRIRDGRAKPIDLLAWYVSSEECVDALEMHEPYTYLNGLQSQDLEDLLEDIKVYKELENNANQAYWEDVQTIVLDELSKLRRLAAPDARRDGVHQAVADDVTQIFKGKTGAQLEALQTQIEQKISGRHDGVDVGYWESLLSQLKAHMSRARLRDRHQTNLRRKLQLLKQEQGVQPARGDQARGDHDVQPARGDQARGDHDVQPARGDQSRGDHDVQPARGDHDVQPARGDLDVQSAHRDQDVQSAHGDQDVQSAHGDQDVQSAHQEQNVQSAQQGPSSQPAQQNLQLEQGVQEQSASRAASPAWDADEGGAAACVALYEAGRYSPAPLAPAAVHTGFEWNKYNQTHYDMDNPPPKIVQGYKFNIFYPDLIDKNSTPEFSLKPCPENPDFAVLRFHAGPPYEDIAFKIVNREWEYSYKRGFRCHFHNNIFQLWFHFKRYRYRR